MPNSAGVESNFPAGKSAAFSGASGRKPVNKQQKKKFKCFGCQKEGHKLSECPAKKKSQESKKNSSHFGEENGVCFVSVWKFSNNCEVSWIVDSGSSEHLTNNKSLFKQLMPMNNPIQIAVAKEGECIVAKHHGAVYRYSQVDGNSIPIILKNVLYIPKARVNILSVRKIGAGSEAVSFKRVLGMKIERNV